MSRQRASPPSDDGSCGTSLGVTRIAITAALAFFPYVAGTALLRAAFDLREGAVDWWCGLMMLFALAGLAAGMLVGRKAWVAGVAVFVVERAAIGPLTGDGALWWLLGIPGLVCFVVPAQAAPALKAAVIRRLPQRT